MGDEVRDATRALLDRKPALRDDIEQLLEYDPDGPWTFQDVPIDSGAFGELVESGLVESLDDGYRLSDRDAIAAIVRGDASDSGSTSESRDIPQARALVTRVNLPNRRRAGTVLGALALLVLVRVGLMLSSVFRPTGVVLAGNDPYMYHHIVEQLASGPLSPFSPADLSQLSIDFLQFEVRTHDTLFIVVVWMATSLLGGASAVSAVLAWYPVVAALITALVVYRLAMQLTNDVRIGVASMLLLAITPAHAYRTALGFGDHHAFDYVWLAVTALAVLIVATERVSLAERSLGISPRGWVAIGVGGIGIAAQSAAWRGGPLLILPIAIYAVARTALDVRDHTDPLSNNGPLVLLVAVGALLTLVAHLGFNWLEPARAFAPALLFVGVVGVVGFAEVVRRLGLPAWTTVAGEVVGLLCTVFVLPRVFPPIAGASTAAVRYFQTYGGSGIAETRSLFSGELGAIAAPLLLFGFVLFLALPYLTWATWRKAGEQGRSDWLAVSAYGWWFFALAIVQNRFSGELSLFTAVFAGIGFVHMAAWIDVARPLSLFTDGQSTRTETTSLVDLPALSTIDRRTVLQIGVLFLLVGSLGGVQTVVKTQQIGHSDIDYQTGTWIAEYADERGLSYPENYVLSRWGANRADNYLVNGETESYEYAQDNYPAFITAESAEGWYQRFATDDVGFILVREVARLSEYGVYSQLHDAYGSRTGDRPALEHYRAVYVTAEDERLVVEVVPGATVTGTAEPATTVTAETTTAVPPAGKTITYSQRVQVGDDGRYQFTTPYPGRYTVGESEVTVPESAVVEGNNVSAS